MTGMFMQYKQIVSKLLHVLAFNYSKTLKITEYLCVIYVRQYNLPITRNY